MIAASLRDGDELVDLLIQKEADVNAASEMSIHSYNKLFETQTNSNYVERLQWPGTASAYYKPSLCVDTRYRQHCILPLRRIILRWREG